MELLNYFKNFCFKTNVKSKFVLKLSKSKAYFLFFLVYFYYYFYVGSKLKINFLTLKKKYFIKFVYFFFYLQNNNKLKKKKIFHQKKFFFYDNNVNLKRKFGSNFYSLKNFKIYYQYYKYLRQDGGYKKGKLHLYLAFRLLKKKYLFDPHFLFVSFLRAYEIPVYIQKQTGKRAKFVNVDVIPSNYPYGWYRTVKFFIEADKKKISNGTLGYRLFDQISSVFNLNYSSIYKIYLTHIYNILILKPIIL